MQLHTTKQRFEQGGVIDSGSYSVEVGPKLFKTLTANLYSDRIRAVIRELSTNAYEAHQLLNKEKIPFAVKLPSQLNTVFSIRDFGPGLDEDGIKQVYTSIFKSTKDSSNEFGGAYGLGSKSPFSYSSSFIVHSYYNGYKYVYFMMVGEDQFPTYSLASKTETTEPNGLEIVIDVKQSDVAEFVNTAKDVFRWFSTKPQVKGNKAYAEIENKVLVSGTGWSFIQSVQKPVALMANVAYPLNGYTGKHAAAINLGKYNGLVLNCAIGDVEPAPSRETLSFDKKTIAAIDRLIDNVLAEINQNCETSIVDSECYWDACNKANSFSFNRLVDISQVKWQGKKLSTSVHFGKNADGLNYFHTMYSGSSRPYVVNQITTTQKVTFVYNDMKRGAASRVFQYTRNSIGLALLCSEGITIEEFCQQAGIIPSKVVMASSLPPVQKYVGARTSYQDKVLQLYTSNRRRIAACWQATEIPLDTTEGYYVPIANNKILHNKREIHPAELFELVRAVGFNKPIYGIRPSLMKKIGPNLKLVMPEIEKLAESRYHDMKGAGVITAVRDRLKHLYYGHFITNTNKIIKQISIDSPINKLYTELNVLNNKRTLAADYSYAKFNKLVFACFSKSYDISKEINAAYERFEKTINDIKVKYPLLFCQIVDGVQHELIYYVKYIDAHGRN